MLHQGSEGRGPVLIELMERVVLITTRGRMLKRLIDILLGNESCDNDAEPPVMYAICHP